MSGSWLEVSLSKLRRNVDVIRKQIPAECRLMAVVKAAAYGHGAREVSRTLRSCGVDSFVVTSLKEAVEIRPFVGDAEILVLEGCRSGQEEDFHHHRLAAAVFTETQKPLAKIPVHIKINSGMNRLGVHWTRAADFIRAWPADNIQGVYTHFSSAAENEEVTRRQLKRFLEVTSYFSFPRHVANSAGLAYPEAAFEAVRPGLVLYGISPSEKLPAFEPIMEWKCRILAVYEVEKGEAVGYNRSFVTQRPSRIAAVGVGYADGYSRLFSNRGVVRVRGKLAPVAGKVSMDLMSVDVSQIEDARVGDEVTLIESETDSPLSVAALASKSGTISWEILTAIAARVERRYVD